MKVYEKGRQQTSQSWLPLFILMGFCFGLTLTFMKGCGDREPATVVIEEQAAPPPAPVPPPSAGGCDGGASLGDVRRLDCPAGQAGAIIEVCNSQGWASTDNSCQKIPDKCDIESEGKVSFNKDVLPLLENAIFAGDRSCADSTCHASYRDYDVFSEVATEALARLRRTDGRRMPQPPNKQWGPVEINVIERWIQGGLIEDSECVGLDAWGNVFKHQTLDDAEEDALEDLQSLDGDSRENARYLFALEPYNRQVSRDTAVVIEKSISKSLNSISTKSNLTSVVPINARRTVFRLDLEDYNLDAHPRFGKRPDGSFKNFWDIVIDNDKFKFVSNTTRGEILIQLTGTQQPWLHMDNFTLIAHGEPEVYYQALGIARTEDEFLAQVGIDLQQRFDDFEIDLAGGFGSPISLNKNRLLLRTTTDRSALAGDDEYFYLTFDPVDVNGVPERNLLEAPLLEQTGSDRVFDFAASEAIWRLPNGLQAYILLAGGLRQNAAPLDIVTDTDGLDPEIENPRDCHRCHAKGIIPMQDTIRDAVLRGNILDADDKELVRQFYVPQRELASLFATDGAKYKQTLTDLELDSQEAPLTYVLDEIENDWSLNRFCAFIFLELEECRLEIAGSADVFAQIGQLLEPGAVVSLNQVVQTFPDVIRDFRLGVDDLDRQ